MSLIIFTSSTYVDKQKCWECSTWIHGHSLPVYFSLRREKRGKEEEKASDPDNVFSICSEIVIDFSLFCLAKWGTYISSGDLLLFSLLLFVPGRERDPRKHHKSSHTEISLLFICKEENREKRENTTTSVKLLLLQQHDHGTVMPEWARD